MAIASTLSESGISRAGIVGGGVEVVKVALFPGNSGDNFTTPDAAPNRLTDEVDIRIDISLDDWMGGFQHMVTKWGNSGDFSYIFGTASGSALRTLLSENGTVFAVALNSIVHNFANGSRHFIRLTAENTLGMITFYETFDEGSSWNIIGSPIASSFSSTLFNTSVNLTVGSTSVGGSTMTGRVYRMQIMDSIDGTLVVDFNPNDYESDSTFTSSITGEVWTLNGGVSIEEE